MGYNALPDFVLLSIAQLEQTDHDLTCQQWAELLRQFSPWDRNRPECYGAPPASALPNRSTLPGTDARVKVYAERFGRGEDLWHEDDLRHERLKLTVGQRVTRNRNGSDQPGDYCLEREAA